jgi:hypothetical protein
MPAMETERGMTAPSVVATSWLAATTTAVLALVSAVCGQGLGALFGGCQWIGVSLPLDRQVWALVNQPVLNFASLPAAVGYWLGSIFLPLAVAVTIIGFLPRPKTLVAEIVSLHVAWAMSTIAVAWLPLVDRADGHLARFLSLHGCSDSWIWLAPGLAASAALLPVLRLLELARRRRSSIGRRHRVWLVSLHLALPTVVWIAITSWIRGAVPVLPTIAIATPLMSAFVLAWLYYPSPHVHPLSKTKSVEILGLVGAAILLVSAAWLAGRPLADGSSAGLLWGQPRSFNNIRPWIEPWPTRDIEHTPPPV